MRFRSILISHKHKHTKDILRSSEEVFIIWTGCYLTVFELRVQLSGLTIFRRKPLKSFDSPKYYTTEKVFLKPLIMYFIFFIFADKLKFGQNMLSKLEKTASSLSWRTWKRLLLLPGHKNDTPFERALENAEISSDSVLANAFQNISSSGFLGRKNVFLKSCYSWRCFSQNPAQEVLTRLLIE